jgi:hypothetical protein
VPNNSAHPFKPVDLDRPERLALLYQQYRSINWRIFYTKYKEIFPSSPIQDKIKFELYDTLHSSFPQSLPGDTAEMQQNRIFQRATEAGIPCGIECNKTNGRVVVLHWLSQRFCYTEDYNKTEKSLSYYNGVRSPNDIACLIDAVLFTQDFKANHPSDTVLVLPYREPGLWEIVKAVTVFVRNGKVYAHNPQVSDAPIPKTKPADLDDPNEFRALRLAGNNAINTIESVKTAEDTTALIQKFCQELKCWVKANGNPDSEATDRYIYEILMRPSNMSNVEVLSVYEKLKAAGVDCQLYASTAERKPDGRIIEYSLPSLGFTFHGARYTYGPEHYCSAANNLILDP